MSPSGMFTSLNRQLVVLFMLICFFKAGLGLKCWECEDNLSWDKCKLLKSITCESPKTRCGSFYTKQGNLERYVKDCYTEEYCTKKPQCTSAFSKCDITCCNTNACNAAAKTKITFSALAFCLITSMLMLFFKH